MTAVWIAALAAAGLIYLLLGCMAIVSGRADRNAPHPPTRHDYEEAA